MLASVNPSLPSLPGSRVSPSAGAETAGTSAALPSPRAPSDSVDLAPALTPADYRVPPNTLVKPFLTHAAVSVGAAGVVGVLSTVLPPVGIALSVVEALVLPAVVDRTGDAAEGTWSTWKRAAVVAGMVGTGVATATFGPLLPAVGAAAIWMAVNGEHALYHAREDVRRPLDEAAEHGQFRTASLFREAVRDRSQPAAFEPEIAAVEALEAAGWRAARSLCEYRFHELGDGQYVRLFPPQRGCRDIVRFSDLPRLVGTSGVTTQSDPGETAAHMRAITLLSEAGAADASFRWSKHLGALLDLGDTAVSLEQSAAEYASLLSVLAHRGQSDGALKIYRAVRRSVSDDPTSESLDDKMGRALSTVVYGGSVDDAIRAALNPRRVESEVTVEKSETAVRIGSLELPVRQ